MPLFNRSKYNRLWALLLQEWGRIGDRRPLYTDKTTGSLASQRSAKATEKRTTLHCRSNEEERKNQVRKLNRRGCKCISDQSVGDFIFVIAVKKIIDCFTCQERVDQIGRAHV